MPHASHLEPFSSTLHVKVKVYQNNHYFTQVTFVRHFAHAQTIVCLARGRAETIEFWTVSKNTWLGWIHSIRLVSELLALTSGLVCICSYLGILCNLPGLLGQTSTRGWVVYISKISCEFLLFHPSHRQHMIHKTFCQEKYICQSVNFYLS